MLLFLGVRDTQILYKAFNETRKGDSQFNVALAIDWILNLPPQSSTSLMPELAPIGNKAVL